METGVPTGVAPQLSMADVAGATLEEERQKVLTSEQKTSELVVRIQAIQNTKTVPLLPSPSLVRLPGVEHKQLRVGSQQAWVGTRGQCDTESL